MRTRLRLAAVVLLVAVAAAPAGGRMHEKFKIVGAIAKVHAEQLDVKAVDGAIYEMDMFESVAVFRRNRKVPRTELREGAKVIVNALGHDMFDLEVVEVHLVD